MLVWAQFYDFISEKRRTQIILIQDQKTQAHRLTANLQLTRRV